MPEKIILPFSRLYDKYPNRIFTKWFRAIAKDIKDRRICGVILDIGTGPGRLPIEIAKQIVNVQVFGIDLSGDMVKIARRHAKEAGLADRVKFKVASAYNTGFEGNSVDLVVSTGMIHHLNEPIRAFNEIYRILKPGGEAWIYDGRKDVTKAEFEETVRSLGLKEDIPLPLWFIERVWPHWHVGCKTEVYVSGKIGRALKESLCKKYGVKNEGAYVKIVLEK